MRVDNATGIVDVVSGLNAGPASYDEAVMKYFLGQYVRMASNIDGVPKIIATVFS